MSYNNPTIPTIPAASGFDAVTESIRIALSALTWLEKSFGRAWEHKEIDIEGKVKKVPKVYTAAGEYLNVLPNDFLQAQSFIRADGPEEWEQFNRFEGSMKSRKLDVIFWVNLKEINPAKDYIFIDELKTEVEGILSIHPAVASMNEYYDERIEDVFEGYSIEDVATQYLMWPYAGMRFNLTVNYPEVCI